MFALRARMCQDIWNTRHSRHLCRSERFSDRKDNTIDTTLPTWVEDIVADLDRLGLPPTAGLGTAQNALRAAGRDVAPNRLRVAVKARKQRDGIPSPVRTKPAPTPSPEPRRAPLPALLAAMVDARLVGAACVGRHELFDAELDDVRESATQRDTRHAAAVALCDTCPVRDNCRTVADEAGRQVHGVWAGTLRNPSRSRKDHAA